MHMHMQEDEALVRAAGADVIATWLRLLISLTFRVRCCQSIAVVASGASGLSARTVLGKRTRAGARNRSVDMGWFSFGDVNWIAVVVATLAGFVVGGAWYHPRVVGRVWMRQVGITEQDIARAGNAGPRYAVVGVVALITTIVMNVLMWELAIGSVMGGVAFGLFIGAVFRLGTHLIHNGFALRGQQLSIIDGLHDMIALAAVGAVIGAFI